MSKLKTKWQNHRCKGCRKNFTIEAKLTQKTKEVICPFCGKHDTKILK